MSQSQIASLYGFIALALVFLFQRRVILSYSMIGAYFVCNLVFVGLGVLLIPWMIPYVKTVFPVFKIGLLTQADYQLTIWLVVGGMIGVLLVYQLAHFIFSGGKIIRRSANLLAPVSAIRVGFPSYRLILAASAMLLLALVFTILNLSVFLSGVREGILLGSPTRIVEARREAGSSYIYVLLIYNIIPFYAVALWVLYKIRGGFLLGIFALASNLFAALLLFSVFQKRPLLVYLIALTLVSIWLRQSKKINPRGWTFSRGVKVVRRYIKLTGMRAFKERLRFLVYGMILFSILMVLYFAQTQIGRSGEGLFETIQTLIFVSISRLLGRLSLPAVFYAHYFPRIDPHYGIRNIGLLSNLFGYTLYVDTPIVYQYFTGRPEGSVAVPALIDFYGAYGIRGWVIGMVALGVLLERMDVLLVRLRPNAGNIVLIVFMLVFAYYMSQASIFRSLLGYGGGIWVVLWFFLRPRLNVAMPVVPQQPMSERPTGSHS